MWHSHSTPLSVGWGQNLHHTVSKSNLNLTLPIHCEQEVADVGRSVASSQPTLQSLGYFSMIFLTLFDQKVSSIISYDGKALLDKGKAS